MKTTILNMKQVCRKLANTKVYNMIEAEKKIKENGVEQYSYLFDGEISYIGFGNFQLVKY